MQPRPRQRPSDWMTRRPAARSLVFAACVAVLCVLAPVGTASAGILSGGPLDVRSLLIINIVVGVIAFCVTASLLFLRAARGARRVEAKAASNAAAYERKMDYLQAVLRAEPQLLVHWSDTGDPTDGGDPTIVSDTLGDDLGVPREVPGLLRFASWLDRESARELEPRIEALRSAGEGFNLMLKTAAGAHVEADGRAAGGGSVLKIRDLAGRRRELADLCEQHRTLDREIGSLRALLDAAPMPAWLRDPDGRIAWVNRAYAHAVDAPDPAAAAAKGVELLDQREQEAARLRLADGEMYRASIKAQTGDGARAYQAIVLPAGGGSAGIALDAASPAAEETDPVESVSGQARVLDRVPSAIAVFGADQRLAYTNPAFRDLWGLDADWLAAGPRDGEVLDRLRERHCLPVQADYRSWKAAHLAIYDSGKARDEWWHLPDGRTLYVVADRGHDGGVTYVYEDLTETLALQSRYNALMHVQKETLDHLDEGVVVFGSDGRLKLFNPSFAALWALDGRALEPESHIDAVIARCRAGLDDRGVWDVLKAAVTGIDDERDKLEGQIERADGVFLAYAGLPLPDGGTLLTFVDVTASKRVENALIERNEALVAADRLKSAFISHVSYELRTPLTNIIGFSEFLQNPAIGDLNDKQQEYLADIRSSSDTLLAIVDDILDLATIDAGALELKIAPAAASEIIEAAILGVRERLQRAGLRLDVRIEPDANELLTDSKRMTQVLYNLLSNAVGFSEAGGTVSVACRRDGDMIAFTVADEGCGIPEDYQSAVFDRFESRPLGSRHRGPGLGLAMVKSLITLHGGSVDLASVPDQGTTVIVRVPAGGPPAGEHAAPQAAA